MFACPDPDRRYRLTSFYVDSRRGFFRQQSGLTNQSAENEQAALPEELGPRNFDEKFKRWVAIDYPLAEMDAAWKSVAQENLRSAAGKAIKPLKKHRTTGRKSQNGGRSRRKGGRESPKSRRPACTSPRKNENASRPSRTTHRRVRYVPALPLQQQGRPKTPAERAVKRKGIRKIRAGHTLQPKGIAEMPDRRTATTAGSQKRRTSARSRSSETTGRVKAARVSGILCARGGDSRVRAHLGWRDPAKECRRSRRRGTRASSAHTVTSRNGLPAGSSRRKRAALRAIDLHFNDFRHEAGSGGRSTT